MVGMPRPHFKNSKWDRRHFNNVEREKKKSAHFKVSFSYLELVEDETYQKNSQLL